MYSPGLPCRELSLPHLARRGMCCGYPPDVSSLPLSQPAHHCRFLHLRLQGKPGCRETEQEKRHGRGSTNALVRRVAVASSTGGIRSPCTRQRTSHRSTWVVAAQTPGLTKESEDGQTTLPPGGVHASNALPRLNRLSLNAKRRLFDDTVLVTFPAPCRIEP